MQRRTVPQVAFPVVALVASLTAPLLDEFREDRQSQRRHPPAMAEVRRDDARVPAVQRSRPVASEGLRGSYCDLYMENATRGTTP